MCLRSSHMSDICAKPISVHNMSGYAYTLHPLIGLERGRVLQIENLCTSFNAIADKVISLAWSVSDFYKKVDILNMPPLYCTMIKMLDCTCNATCTSLMRCASYANVETQSATSGLVQANRAALRLAPRSAARSVQPCEAIDRRSSPETTCPTQQ